MGLEAVRQMPQPGTSTVKSPVFLAAAIFLHPVSLAAATVFGRSKSSFTPPAAEMVPLSMTARREQRRKASSRLWVTSTVWHSRERRSSFNSACSCSLR